MPDKRDAEPLNPKKKKQNGAWHKYVMYWYTSLLLLYMTCNGVSVGVMRQYKHCIIMLK